jgi:hypothetical protein
MLSKILQRVKERYHDAYVGNKREYRAIKPNIKGCGTPTISRPMLFKSLL